MLDRRYCLNVGLCLAGSLFVSRGAHAQVVDKAVAFIQQIGTQLTAVVNGSMPAAEKRRALARIVESAADINGIARFCLGRFWRTASGDQQQRFIAAFHEVLITNIATKLGEYQGVKMTVQHGRQQDDEGIVTTIVDRPNNPPTSVDWVIEQPTITPKIVDVIAEGTSLRLTQRQDYAAYLARNNNDIDALISAMKRQSAQNG